MTMAGESKKVITGYLLDDTVTLSMDELGCACAVETQRIVQLVEEGILEPIDSHQQQWCFSAAALGRARKAIRLQRDLNVNLAGVALALDLLDEVEHLRARLRYLEERD